MCSNDLWGLSTETHSRRLVVRVTEAKVPRPSSRCPVGNGPELMPISARLPSASPTERRPRTFGSAFSRRSMTQRVRIIRPRYSECRIPAAWGCTHRRFRAVDAEHSAGPPGDHRWLDAGARGPPRSSVRESHATRTPPSRSPRRPSRARCPHHQLGPAEHREGVAGTDVAPREVEVPLALLPNTAGP